MINKNKNKKKKIKIHLLSLMLVFTVVVSGVLLFVSFLEEATRKDKIFKKQNNNLK